MRGGGGIPTATLLNPRLLSSSVKNPCTAQYGINLILDGGFNLVE